MNTDDIYIKTQPITPLAPYLGGKRLLAKTIIPIINKIPHKIYAEPFIGMGGVFFRRSQKPKCEAINDINSEIINLFRMVEKYPDYLADMLKFKLCSRAEFKFMLATPPLLLTELERAVRYLYIQKNAFGGQTQHQSFGLSLDGRCRFDNNKLALAIYQLNQRLQGVYVECLPYQDFITLYDRPATLFYLDPPYWGCENDYGKNIFNKADFDNLSTLLKQIKGKFVMSLNDVPEIRAIFKAFYIKEVQTAYSIRQNKMKKNKPAAELLISNVDINKL